MESGTAGGVAQHELRQRFRDELSSLEAHTLGALDLVTREIDRSLEALEHQDVELAEMIVADDDRLDGRFLEVHQGILSLLALQAPVAGDLRLVAALLLATILRMGRQARSEVVQCKRAFTERDVALAEDLVRQDREINRANREVFR